MKKLTRNNNDLIIEEPGPLSALPETTNATSPSIDGLNKRLHDQNFYTRSLIESSIDAIMTTDINGTITDVNRCMVDLSGRTRDELLGAPCRKLFTDPARADALIAQVLANQKISDYELTVRSFVGTEVEVSFNASTLHDRERTVYGVFASARDVTETKNLERALREQNAKFMEMNSARADYLKVAQVVLLQPLKNIVAESAAMASGGDGVLTDAQQLRIDRIQAMGEKLFLLLGDLIGMSRVETGLIELEYADVDVEILLRAAVSRNEPQKLPGVSISVQVAPDLHHFPLDAVRLNEIMDILLSNSLKATGERGDIDVRAGVVDGTGVGRRSGSLPIFVIPQKEPSGGDFLQISVTDAGIGIDEAELPEIFLPLRRVVENPHRRFDGHGVGLNKLKLLVHAHGGAVLVESALGAGSTFVVWLPRHEAQSGGLHATR